MPRLTTPITPITGTRYTLAPLYFSTSASALKEITANPIRVIVAGGVVFGAEMGTTTAPGAETGDLYS